MGGRGGGAVGACAAFVPFLPDAAVCFVDVPHCVPWVLLGASCHRPFLGLAATLHS